ncbi:hypothetical protein Fleli_2014 [Bernardetia litoralis DSM 6794]|uniref:Uncharacterized protein n=1 Tax=Bernardetia litoralis (strain ATCC 23117 / DSM 6794 / NBRC 15988 / NCIMB 1366 / Fx l1 / Sio-4) TaxID=880071 RepID=I4AKB3_BERLS|nr:hypothetical protein [Bernardetia litoralis]AFM04398.1 hypothetical protein Fleli_2014 [Bernardetia litoralis DSM 6794]
MSYIISYVSFQVAFRGQIDIENDVPTWITVFSNTIGLLDALITILVIKKLRDTEIELRKHGGF